MKEYELYHASTRKHKYIKKIGNRYFYTQDEINAYLQGKKDPEKSIDKKRKQLHDVREAVAEATGRRDVYFEAKKVTENGRTYYDDDNAQLKTGKKDKRGRVGDDGSVYTKKGTMQYDNEYTRELNKKTRERGKKKLKKMAMSPVRNLKKQSAKGKKKLESIYKPKSTVTIVDRVDSRTGKHF